MGEGSSPSLPLRAGRPGSTTAQPHLQKNKHVTRGDEGRSWFWEKENRPHTFETSTDEGG